MRPVPDRRLMTLALDHIVIAVADLARARAAYTALGFTVLEGGEHADGVTHNALVVLADGAYLELIAWKRQAPDNRWWRVLEEAGEGLVDFALLPRDIAADVAAAQARGLDLEGPVPGGRLRPDGERLEWRIARSPRPDVPFLCGDVTPRRLRVPEGDIRNHPNGVTGIVALTVAVEDIERSLARYGAYLGLAATPDGPMARDLAGFGMRIAAVPLAQAAITLGSPLPGRDGPLTGSLRRRGEGLFALAFRTAGAKGPLDPALTHGAILEAV